MLIDKNRLLQTVEVGGTIGTRFKVFHDGPAFGRINVFVEVPADVFCHVEAINSLQIHVVMYSLSCSRRNTLARLRRDLTAGTDNFSILETASAD